MKITLISLYANGMVYLYLSKSDLILAAITKYSIMNGTKIADLVKITLISLYAYGMVYLYLSKSDLRLGAIMKYSKMNDGTWELHEANAEYYDV